MLSTSKISNVCLVWSLMTFSRLLLCLALSCVLKRIFNELKHSYINILALLQDLEACSMRMLENGAMCSSQYLSDATDAFDSLLISSSKIFN